MDFKHKRSTTDTERINHYLKQASGLRSYHKMRLPIAPEIRKPSGVLPPPVRPEMPSWWALAPIAAFLFCSIAVLGGVYVVAFLEWVLL